MAGVMCRVMLVGCHGIDCSRRPWTVMTERFNGIVQCTEENQDMAVVDIHM